MHIPDGIPDTRYQIQEYGDLKARFRSLSRYKESEVKAILGYQLFYWFISLGSRACRQRRRKEPANIQ